MFAPHQYNQIVLSDIGIVIWLAAVITWSYYNGFAEVFRLYLVPYLWYVSFHITIQCVFIFAVQGQPLAGLDYIPPTY
jgi:uncharacterized membrane protein